MGVTRLIGIVLIVAGIVALVYGGFSYTRHTSSADVGPVHVSVAHRETVPVPIWAGIGIVVLGGVLLAGGSRRA